VTLGRVCVSGHLGEAVVMSLGVAVGGYPLGRELLDLGCAPASSLPETYQRYRLVAHLGSGGQADVYRADPLCRVDSFGPMDVKPSNVMVLATGEVRLSDFTGARYWRAEEITQIAYTPESGGPEAFGGVSQLSPAYDVHGFGAVAYLLVTGEYPREPGRVAS